MSEQKEVVRVVERGTILTARVPGTPTIRFEELLVNAHGVVRFSYTDLTTHKKSVRPIGDLHTFWRLVSLDTPKASG